VRSPARRFRSRRLPSMLGALFILGGLLPVVVPVSVLAASPDVVISEVYGGGGNSGATYTHDYIELYNRGAAPVSLASNSVQYASATGTGFFGANSGQLTELPAVTLNPGQYLLIQESSQAAVGAPLPTPDVTDSTPINMSGTGGKVAYVTGTSSLGCNGSAAQPCSDAALARIVDLVGYGSANFFEGTGPAPAPSNTTAAIRAAGGATDTDDNAADFAAGIPDPDNGAGPGDATPSVSSTTPANNATNVSTSANVSITFSEAVDVTGSWFSISCTVSDGHAATVSGGPMTFTLNPESDFANGETCTVTVVAEEVSDQDASDPPDHPLVNHVFSFTTEAPLLPPTPIHDIQGAGHLSPLAGQTLNTVGTVTVKSGNGFWMQTADADVDANDATSEAIFVFTSTAPTVTVGDAVRVAGTISEFRPGGASSTNLTTTEITGPSISVLSSGNTVPTATIVGDGGRTQPTMVIENDTSGTPPLSVETSGDFDPQQDGIDFYESLEGMRLQVNRPIVVGPTNGFGETWIVPDGGENAEVITTRGGIVVRDGDFNPERIQIDDTLVPLPVLNVGDGYGASITGVLDYNFGNFELLPTATPSGVNNGLTREVTTPITHPDVISIGTFNVENLDPGDPDAKFQQLASLIVHNLRSPDVLSLEEIQDSNGPTNDGTVDATLTLNELVAAIQSEGGPAYEFRQINPLNNQDGGEPGGNIRVGFLFRTDRGVAFVDRPGGDSTTPTTIVAGPEGPQLSASPGRIDPTNAAWATSRKPLAGEFTFNGHHFFAITNHFNSKSGDQPLFGRFQPPTLISQVQRLQQAAIVNDFVDDILAVDPDAEVVVLGDLNDFEFSPPVRTLVGDPAVLTPLMETLPQEERYSYVFEGNSQSLDHIVVSDSLLALTQEYDVVHVNAEFAIQASDHDPQVVKVQLGCQFSTSGTTMTLLTDCITDDTIHIPNGWTLDGDGHTITGVDPEDGHFLGAVVANAGAVAHVTDLTVTVDGLADVCDAGAARLRGILFDGAAGSITNSHAVDINQGPSGCQEGNGIEVRNAPFDTSGPDVAVTISGNVVTGYQKTGILANGSVVASILSNIVTGAGPIGYIAQNGVQVGFGGSGLVKANTISGNSYTGPDVACGILFFDADGVKQQANILFDNERDVCNFGRGGGNSKPVK
jgi:predicted extracellular nuclease